MENHFFLKILPLYHCSTKCITACITVFANSKYFGLYHLLMSIRSEEEPLS